MHTPVGHLDRVVQGATAEEILNACDEKLEIGSKLTDPTISIAQVCVYVCIEHLI